MSEQAQIKDFIDRDYQLNIIDVCLKQNSIVYLPTGAGKTYIAIQVIKTFSDQLNGKYSDGAKRSFFLVNTVALAKQQAEHIKQFLPFNVCVLTGESNVDGFKMDDWLKYLDANEILVMTAQCFADAVAKTFIRLESVSVIIFDECHHGRKGHPYRQIMQSFESCESPEDIKIVGLSGMLIGNDNSTKPETVHEELRQLESVYQSTIITVNNIHDQKNVLIYSTKAKEFAITFSYTPVKACLELLRENLRDLQTYLRPVQLNNYSNLNPKTLRETGPTKIKELINLLKDFEYQTGVLGDYGCFLALMSILIQLELIKRSADSEKFRNIVKVCITRVEKSIAYIKRELNFSEKSSKIVLENSSEKVQKLLILLKKFYDDPDREKDMQCLIFTERRSTAKILYHLIKCFGADDENFPIKPDFVVGRNNSLPESIETIMAYSNNVLALEKFERRETNCIVCTNVLEEGIDLQACNLVIIFDPPKTPRSYVQSRGRARDDKSSYIVMLENNERAKFNKNLTKWQKIDQVMKKALIGKTIDRLPPSEEDIKNEQAQEWEPFLTKEKARLTALNCIQILNQFAQSLPADRFTNVNIGWQRIDHKIGCSVNLLLPVQSMLDYVIVGDPQQNIKIAKQDAAFKACKKLYFNGNLTEQLTPVNNEIQVEQYNETYFEHWKKYADDNPKRAGTKNFRRFHKIRVPKALQDCGPTVGTNFLYRIKIKPKFETENNNVLQVFHTLLDNENTFGILTLKRIPKLCVMTLFQTYGEIECEISELPTIVEIQDTKSLQKLQKFHINIFRDVLKAFQNFFVLDKTSYLIVPLNDCNEIYWPIVDKFQEIPEPCLLTKSQIEKMDFKAEDYLFNVINPVYREHTQQNYVVINVVNHKTPLSQFPNKNTFMTYLDYFKDKYNLTIHREDQFLIEVKGISQNFKLFFPGSGVSGKQKKYERLTDCEEYIPEICHNYKFPGDFWLKATLLPSICHRMFYMLMAEELRRWLISENIDKDNGQQIYKLDIDYGNYDERVEILKQSDESPEKLEEFEKIWKMIKEKEANDREAKRTIRTEASMKWGNSLPVDLDRNWTNISEPDIDYYWNFINGRQKMDESTKNNFKKFVTLRQNPAKNLSIKDKVICNDIKLLRQSNMTNSIQQKDLIKVLTTANAGDVFDMERYEALGDGFLKFIASLFLYKTHSKWHEGYLTALKGKLVSNRNLFYVGNDFGLSEMLKASVFSHDSSFAPSTKLPTNLKGILKENKNLLTNLLDVCTKLSNDEVDSGIMKNLELFNRNTTMDEDNVDRVDKTLVGFVDEQYIGDKVVADSVEALLGCTVSSIGTAAALKLCQKLKILPQDTKVEKLLTEPIAPRIVFESDLKIVNQGLLEKKIGYKFKNSIYLTQALTHASYPNKASGTYQQLEFLGDAVLDFLITSYIFERCEKMSPGKLTDLRSALVNNVTLACIVVRNDIHKHMLFENHLLAEAIRHFVNFQQSQNHEITDQIILLQTEDDTTIAKSIEVPKALGDIFESIVGAVFLDTNLSLEKTWNVIYSLMKNELQKFMDDVPLQIIRRLFEFQGGKAKPKFFKTEMIDGDENVAVPLKINNREGNEEFIIGFGKNRKMAKEAAVKKALLALQKDF